MLRCIAPFVLAAFSSVAASAATIDTTTSWPGWFTSGHASVGQTLTVNPDEAVLDDISFFFRAGPAGSEYLLTISELGTGTTLLSRSFHAVAGRNLFTLGLDLSGVSQILADISSSSFSGFSAGYLTDAYSGGVGAFSGSLTDSYDLAFIANFSAGGDEGPSPVPLPATLPLLATVLLGGGLVARRGRRT